MKKLLSFLSKSALVFCLTLSFAHAMDYEDVSHNRGGRGKCTRSVRQKIIPYASEEMQLPNEILSRIIFYTLRFEPLSLQRILLVCTRWQDAILIKDQIPLDFRPFYKKLTYEILNRFSNNIITLDLFNNKVITDDHLKLLPKLLILDLGGNATITNNGIKNLTNLTRLDLRDCDAWVEAIVTNEGVMHLTNLTTLILHGNTKVTGEVFKNLTNLTSLDLSCNELIRDDDLKPLSKLVSLYLAENDDITGKALKNLTNLTELNLYHNALITDDDLKFLPKLVRLDLGLYDYCDLYGDYCCRIRNIMHLTNLTTLSLEPGTRFESIMHLTNLTELFIDPMEWYLFPIDWKVTVDKWAAGDWKVYDKDGKISEEITWPEIRPLKKLRNWEELRNEFGPNFVKGCRKGSMRYHKRGSETQNPFDSVIAFSQALKFLSFVLEDFPEMVTQIDINNYQLTHNDLIFTLNKINSYSCNLMLQKNNESSSAIAENK